MEQQTKAGKYSLFMKCIAVMLIVALMVNFTLAANAAASTEYVREVIVVVASDSVGAKAQAKKASEKTKDPEHPENERTYYVVDTPIYDSGTTKTWLCYATTTKASLALTSVKAMNMAGGWSYEEYDKLLEDLLQKARILVDDLLIAVREYNANLAANKSTAVYAKSVLDLLKKDDDPEKVQLVSEFFAEAGTEPLGEQEENEYIDRMTTLTMQANTSLLASIENALMIACAETKTNLFDALENPVYLSSIDGIQESKVYHDTYDLAADDLITSLPSMQENLYFYLDSDHPYTEDMERMALQQEEAVNESLEGLSDEDALIQRKEVADEIRTMAAQEDNPFGLEDKDFQAAQDLYDYDVYYNNELTEDEQRKYTTGRMLAAAFEGCEYLGYNDANGEREYLNLLGLMTKYNLNASDTPKENYKRSDFYPMLHLMSPGQRAMLKVGITQLVSSIVTRKENTDYLNINKMLTLAAINEKAEVGMEIKDGDTVSVYYGVDRSLFEENSGIALTKKAFDERYDHPLGESLQKHAKSEQIATYVMMASGATAAMLTTASLALPLAMKLYFSSVTFTGMPVSRTLAGVTFVMRNPANPMMITEQFLGRKMSYGYYKLVDLGTSRSGTFVGSFGDCFKAFISSGGLGTFMTVFNILSIAALIISAIVKIVEHQKSLNDDTPYIDIPRVMCSYQEVFTDSGQSDEEDYMYYYGVKNPLLEQADQDRAAAKKDKNNKETTNILKYRVADVANWTLHGENREWIALYASSDERAGRPILAGSFVVTTKRDDIGPEYTAVQRFNYGGAYDMHTYYGYSIRQTVPQRFIAYRMERTAAAGSASVFSGISPIGTLVVGIVAGGAVGTLITFFVSKKRKTAQ